MGRLKSAVGATFRVGARLVLGSEQRRADEATIRDGLDDLTDDQLREIVEDYFE